MTEPQDPNYDYSVETNQKNKEFFKWFVDNGKMSAFKPTENKSFGWKWIDIIDKGNGEHEIVEPDLKQHEQKYD